MMEPGLIVELICEHCGEMSHVKFVGSKLDCWNCRGVTDVRKQVQLGSPVSRPLGFPSEESRPASSGDVRKRYEDRR